MPRGTEFETLLERIVSDGMIIRRIVVPVSEVVFLKSVLEAYPGLAAVHAERAHSRRGQTADDAPKGTTLVVATTPGFESELDELLAELRRECSAAVA